MPPIWTQVFLRLSQPRVVLLASQTIVNAWRLQSLAQARHFSSQSNVKEPLRVLYFGSDDFAIPTLKMLHSKRDCGQLAELAVVCVRLRAGRTAARRYAERHGLAVLDWPLEPAQLAAGRYHLGVVASFGHLLPKRLIDQFPAGMVNVHASLLPRWRGAAPVVHAILAGDAETGVTIMTIKPHRFDVGDIVSQAAVPIPPSAGVAQLTSQLARLGADLMERCLDDLPASLAAARPQPQHGVTLAPRLTPADYRVSWERPCAALLRQSRALPGPLVTGWRGRRVRLPTLSAGPEPAESALSAGPASADPALSASPNTAEPALSASPEPAEPVLSASPDPAEPARPGRLVRHQRTLLVRCGDGWLELPRLQPQGKRVMTGEEFWNGYLSAVPDDQRYLDRYYDDS